jgi:hypothetical protein
VPDFLDDKRREISERLRELKPAVDESNRLEAAAAALAGVRGSSSASVTPRRRGPGRPRGSKTRTATKAKKATTTARKVRRKKPGRPPGSGKKPGRPARSAKKPGRPPASAKRRAGRRKGSGTRAAQALSFVQGQPGITIPELAAKMGIKQNYLYRVLPGLEQENKVEKKGRGWYPKG